MSYTQTNIVYDRNTFNDYTVVTPSTMQSAIDQGHKKLFLSNGEYNIDVVMPVQSKWIGESKNAIFRGALGLTIGCELDNLTIFPTNGKFKSVGINGRSYNNTVTNCKISNELGNGFYSNDVSFYDTVFTNCEFTDCALNGTHMVSKENDLVIHDVSFVNCYFHDNERINFEIWTGDVNMSQKYYNVNLDGCTFDGTNLSDEWGINVSYDGSGHNCTVSDCAIIGGWRYAFEVAGATDITVDGCVITGMISCSRLSKMHCGLIIQNSNVTYGIIIGNDMIFKNNVVSESITFTHAEHCKIINNQFAYKPGVTELTEGEIMQLIFDDSSHNLVDGNLFTDSLVSSHIINGNTPIRIYRPGSVYNTVRNNTFTGKFIKYMCEYGQEKYDTKSDETLQIFYNNVLNGITVEGEVIMATEITSPILLDETGQDIKAQLASLNTTQASILEALGTIAAAIENITISGGPSEEVIKCETITLNQSTVNGNIGDTIQLTATVSPEDTTQTVRWTTSNSNVATVNDGLVTFVAEGTVTIKAICGTKNASCSVTVTDPYACTGITLSGSSSVTVGNTIQLTATVTPSTCNKPIIWATSDSNIATVSNGTVTGVSEGSVTITATCDGKVATYSIESMEDLGTEIFNEDFYIAKLSLGNAPSTVGDSVTNGSSVLAANSKLLTNKKFMHFVPAGKKVSIKVVSEGRISITAVALGEAITTSSKMTRSDADFALVPSNIDGLEDVSGHVFTGTNITLFYGAELKTLYKINDRTTVGVTEFTPSEDCWIVIIRQYSDQRVITDAADCASKARVFVED